MAPSERVRPMDPPTVPIQESSDEVAALRGYLRDLVALSTLPAVWVGQSPETIVESFVDALLGTLRVDFVYARLESHAGSDTVIEAAHTASGPAGALRARQIGEALAPWLRPRE